MYANDNLEVLSSDLHWSLAPAEMDGNQDVQLNAVQNKHLNPGPMATFFHNVSRD